MLFRSVLVAPASRDAVVDGFEAAMIELAASAQRRQQLGEQGLRKVESDFDWELKVDAMLNIYRAAMQQRAPDAQRTAHERKPEI